MGSRYVARRVLSSLIVIILIPVAVFFLARLIGDPVALMIQPQMTEQQVAQLRQSLGFSGPLYQQFFTFTGKAIRGDFGVSLWQQQPAMRLILERMPATATLAVAALLFSVMIALPIGAISARWVGTPVDRGVMLVALFGQSIPNFWLGLMGILIFSVKLGWLPTSGYGDNWTSRLLHLLMPMITLGLFGMSRLARLTRSGLLEVLGQDHVRTARAKGLAEWPVFWRHATKNALIPVITILALDVSALLSGAVVTETIFAWPGVGRLMFQAIEQRDFPVIQAGAVVLGVIYTLANLVADILYTRVDPRIRYG